MTEIKPAHDFQRFLPFLLNGLGFVLITASAFYLYRNLPPRADVGVVPATVNYPAPELTLTDLDVVSRSLADYRGQIALVNLWATWCEPCKEEMTDLQAYYDKHKADGFTEQAFKTLGLPSANVIDRSGTVRLQWVGRMDRRSLEKYVTPIITEEQ